MLLKDFTKRHDTAVILHIYYPELWDEIAGHLEHLNGQYDLFVSIPEDVKIADEMILEHKPDVKVYRCKNRGRDIAPFLDIFGAIANLDYKYVCKIHTKKTVHREDGDQWRGQILDELLGSGSKIMAVKERLDAGDIGIIGPRGQLISTEYFMGGNEELVSELAKKLNLNYEGEYFPFIAGSMFWFKPAAIRPVLSLSLVTDDFPVENGQKDATLAHALERTLCLIAKSTGYKVIETGTYAETPGSDFPFAVPLRKEP